MCIRPTASFHLTRLCLPTEILFLFVFCPLSAPNRFSPRRVSFSYLTATLDARENPLTVQRVSLEGCLGATARGVIRGIRAHSIHPKLRPKLTSTLILDCFFFTSRLFSFFFFLLRNFSHTIVFFFYFHFANQYLMKEGSGLIERILILLLQLQRIILFFFKWTIGHWFLSVFWKYIVMLERHQLPVKPNDSRPKEFLVKKNAGIVKKREKIIIVKVHLEGSTRKANRTTLNDAT